jgi:hypothetical protein
VPIEGAVLFELDLNNPSPAIVPIKGAVLFALDLNTDCTDRLQSGQLYVGPFQLHQFDIGGKGPIQMIRIQV